MIEEELNDTTRKFPRTLDEAFPNDPQSAQWLYVEPKSTTLGTVLSVIGIIAWALFLYYLVCLIEMRGQ